MVSLKKETLDKTAYRKLKKTVLSSENISYDTLYINSITHSSHSWSLNIWIFIFKVSIKIYNKTTARVAYL